MLALVCLAPPGSTDEGRTKGHCVKPINRSVCSSSRTTSLARSRRWPCESVSVKRWTSTATRGAAGATSAARRTGWAAPGTASRVATARRQTPQSAHRAPSSAPTTLWCTLCATRSTCSCPGTASTARARSRTGRASRSTGSTTSPTGVCACRCPPTRRRCSGGTCPPSAGCDRSRGTSARSARCCASCRWRTGCGSRHCARSWRPTASGRCSPPRWPCGRVRAPPASRCAWADI